MTIPSDSQKNKVKQYTIMYENTPVLKLNRETDDVVRGDQLFKGMGIIA